MRELGSEDFDSFIKQNRIAVVDFWAPWCMPCLALEPVIKEVEKKLPEIAFGKLNVDENVELARKYGIMSIPTIIIFVNGMEVDRIIGYVSEEEIAGRISNYSGSFFP